MVFHRREYIILEVTLLHEHSNGIFPFLESEEAFKLDYLFLFLFLFLFWFWFLFFLPFLSFFLLFHFSKPCALLLSQSYTNQSGKLQAFGSFDFQDQDPGLHVEVERVSI